MTTKIGHNRNISLTTWQQLITVSIDQEQDFKHFEIIFNLFWKISCTIIVGWEKIISNSLWPFSKLILSWNFFQSQNRMPAGTIKNQSLLSKTNSDQPH